MELTVPAPVRFPGEGEPATGELTVTLGDLESISFLPKTPYNALSCASPPAPPPAPPPEMAAVWELRPTVESSVEGGGFFLL